MSSLSCQFPILYACSIFTGAIGPPKVHLLLLRSGIGCQVKPLSQDPIYLPFLKYHLGKEEKMELLFIEHQVF